MRLFLLLAVFSTGALSQDWGRYFDAQTSAIMRPTMRPIIPPPVIQIQPIVPAKRFTPATVNAMNRELAGLPIAKPITAADMARLERPPSHGGFPK